MLEYLTVTAVAPLQRDFVEIEDPYCSRVRTSVPNKNAKLSENTEYRWYSLTENNLTTIILIFFYYFGNLIL